MQVMCFWCRQMFEHPSNVINSPEELLCERCKNQELGIFALQLLVGHPQQRTQSLGEILELIWKAQKKATESFPPEKVEEYNKGFKVALATVAFVLSIDTDGELQDVIVGDPL